MSILFTLLGAIAYLAGIAFFMAAKSSIHEGVALIAILNGTVFFVGAGIISTISCSKDNSINSENEVVKEGSLPSNDISLNETPLTQSEHSKNDKDEKIVQSSSHLSKNTVLINTLKKSSLSIDFNTTFKLCEICNDSKTGQLINQHFVCSNCKDSYL
ncbi:hypothetical protein GCM10007916_23320 [Psychromonas marina]|uniref:Uncharacterized protein n=1 Tax=Psychromonas marina TaxID=88364 RepID=A0ABQ6E1I8_9GAMM|nr:hypothetical protein [Psychromonas marina]GLS91263.1 hypothetical protein GCM10007916_23320 [Psychromonas marina]